MNCRIVGFLPLSLLLSTVMYAMDTQAPEKKVADADLKESMHETTTLTLSPESVVISKKASSKETPVLSASTTTVQSKSLGAVTGFKDWWYGESSNVAHEIATDTFDPAIPANNRRLFKAIEKLTQSYDYESLKSLNTLLTNCQTKNIAIDDSSVMKLTREYALAMRTREEEQLEKEATLALENANKKRATVMEEVSKKLAEAKEIITASDKELSAELDNVYKKHGDTILLATTAKRLTRRVNQHIPEDGYDSDEDSKYDRPFNAQKLELDQPTEQNHKLNRRVVGNLETLEELIGIADKQSIKKAMAPKAVTQPEQQPQQ